MPIATKPKGVLDAYRIPGFRAKARLRGVFGDPKRESLHWSGAQKNSVRFLWASILGLLQPHPAAGRDLSCGDMRIYLHFEVRRVECRSCGKVKRERLDIVADNPFYTKRFAYYVGRRCRAATIKDIAEELKLDWHAVKELDKQYMTAQLAKAGRPGPKVIGVDEISTHKCDEPKKLVQTLRTLSLRGQYFFTRNSEEPDNHDRYRGASKAVVFSLPRAVN